MEAGIGYLEIDSQGYKDLLKAAIKYLKTGNQMHLEKAFTEEYLDNIFNKITEYNEDDIYTIAEDLEFYEIKRGEDEPRFKDADDYIQYRQSIIDSAKKIGVKKARAEMRRLYVEVLTEYLDQHKEQYEREEDYTEWEANLIQPIIISVSKDSSFNQYNLDSGANLAITEFKPEDMEKLIEFVAKIKSNPASLSSRKLTRAKGEFYKSKEDVLEGRASRDYC